MPRAHVYYGQKPAEPEFVYKEFTLGELVRIVKKDKASFPNGLKTKLSPSRVG